MQRGDLAKSITRKSFICFILAAMLIIRTIVLATFIDFNIIVIIVEIIEITMSILSITTGIIALSLKKNLAKNVLLLTRRIRIISLIWFALGTIGFALTILEAIFNSFDNVAQMMGAIATFFALFFLGFTFLMMFYSSLQLYIKASCSEKSEQNESMIDTYLYVDAQSNFPNQPIPGLDFISSSPIVVDQPLFSPLAGNNHNQMFGNGIPQYGNPYGAPPKIQPSN